MDSMKYSKMDLVNDKKLGALNGYIAKAGIDRDGDLIIVVPFPKGCETGENLLREIKRAGRKRK
ncbi:MAG: hypothetical protein JRD89_04870 [Deltaproteobacteria bacterium]|nr:hypothetical protein [Deltaproteobacteria bacterium]